MIDSRRLLAARRIVFWDFDGVIKDSLEVKSNAFEQLFAPYGAALGRRVREHHEAHGGVSRFDKVPTYLAWAGLPADAGSVQMFCERFSLMVRQGVIDSPWVPGVREYLQSQCSAQTFVLVTATPQEEIEGILDALAIKSCFREVFGAPHTKTVAIGTVLRRSGCSPEHALMIGDTEADLGAATANDVPFLLRRTPLNRKLQQAHSGPMFDGLPYE